MTIAITGAGGFVGRHFVAECEARGYPVRPLVRRARGPGDTEIGDIAAPPDWAAILAGCDTVIHAAARVHQMEDRSADPLADYRRVNTEATAALAQGAARAGVRRMVFLSSIKVNGESTTRGRPFRADDRPSPEDPYGVSKWEAEQRLAEIAARSGLEVVIVRPPLVYGPGVGANLHRMMRWLSRGLPLPLGAIDNRRSLIGIGNLCDILLTIATARDVAGKTFLVSDGDDVSTTRMLRILRDALGSRSVLLPVPQALLSKTLGVLGGRNLADRLIGDLQISSDATNRHLGWRPPHTVEEGLAQTAAAFVATNT
ncbi:NAD-dependent epimerase/dehydratase family protein [Qipengyuania sp. MTN3-11]|uniref:NAD-dependent epimerase/dehydratase family protein n=1 Tax=Qipengyuania sp. MTN3-11 TaxID=3056557 RepID=UPI0036F21A38